jgi:predicted ATP-dependent endonuclease of OLD family
VQVILATHSVEIISEVESEAILSIHKGHHSARRLVNSKELQHVLRVLGSNANPILTQLAKTRRVLFVEGKDFQVISRFARTLGRIQVANRSEFAVIPVEGFQPHSVKNFASGMEATLGCGVLKAVIFDRDYRASADVNKITHELERFCAFAVIHERNEIENFLLVPSAISRAIANVAAKIAERTGKVIAVAESVDELLAELAESFRHNIFGQYCARRREWIKRQQPGLDEATITAQLAKDFEAEWSDFEKRMRLVPGKDMLAALNTHLQNQYGITLTRQAILDSFGQAEVPLEMAALIEKLQAFRTTEPAD